MAQELESSCKLYEPTTVSSKSYQTGMSFQPFTLWVMGYKWLSQWCYNMAVNANRCAIYY